MAGLGEGPAVNGQVSLGELAVIEAAATQAQSALPVVEAEPASELVAAPEALAHDSLLRRPARQDRAGRSPAQALWQMFPAEVASSSNGQRGQDLRDQDRPELDQATESVSEARETLQAKRSEIVAALRQRAGRPTEGEDRSTASLEAKLEEVSRQLASIDGQPWVLTTVDVAVDRAVAGRSGRDANPGEAVSHLVFDLEFAASTTEETARVQAAVFTDQLAAHREDANWLREFFAGLGSQRAADLIEQALRPENYSGVAGGEVSAAVDQVRSALEVLFAAGSWSRGDFDVLLKRWLRLECGEPPDDASRRGLDTGRSFNTGVAIALRAASRGVRSLFFGAARELSFDPSLEEAIRVESAAAAAYVLSGGGSDEQIEQLVAVVRDAQLGPFVERAMQGRRLVRTLRSAADADDGDAVDPRRTQERSYDGLAKLAFTAAYADLYTRDFAQGVPPFSQDGLSDVRRELFLSAAGRLPACRSTWSCNTMLKDGLAVSLRHEFDRLWRQHLETTGDRPQFAPRLSAALDGFFECVLFSSPSGSARDATSSFFASLLAQWIDDAANPDFSDRVFVEVYGCEKLVLVGLAGELLQKLVRGAERSLAAVDGSRATRERLLRTAGYVAQTDADLANAILATAELAPVANESEAHEPETRESAPQTYPIGAWWPLVSERLRAESEELAQVWEQAMVLAGEPSLCTAVG